MLKILVTGGAGFIGSNFIHFLLNRKQDVHIFNLDALTYAGRLENLQDLPDPTRHTFLKGDICDESIVTKLIQQYQIDTIINFAAETHVDRSIQSGAAFIQTNVFGTFTLLKCAQNLWDHNQRSNCRFLHISTDEVYGSLNSDDPPFTEKTPHAPNSIYAASKSASDQLVRAFFQTHKIPILITNCSNNYGPRQFPEKMIPLMISNALQGGSLPIYGDGLHIRDWLFVEDHCRALLQVLEKGVPGEIYNIGGGNQPSNLEIVKMVCSYLDECRPLKRGSSYSEKIQFVADRPGHDRRYAMDISKIRREIGWQPKVDIVNGLHQTIDWYLENSAWLASIKAQPGYIDWLKFNYQDREMKP